MKKWFVLLMLFSPALFAEVTSAFKINGITVLGAGNMMFRVHGMPQPASCPGNAWAYVDDADSGSKTKISTLLSAYAAGKRVQLEISPKNFFSNGVMYCQIISMSVFD